MNSTEEEDHHRKQNREECMVLANNVHDKNAAHAQWIMDEMDRVWFHDNVVDLSATRSWFRSLFETREYSSPSPRKQGFSRNLRELGKVFSTGDLSRGVRPMIDVDFKKRLFLSEEEEFSNDTGGSNSPAAADDFEFKVAKLETIPSASTLIPQMLEAISPLENSSKPPHLGSKHKRRSRRRKKHTRSLTDLEFDEIRGFRDLGFKVNEAEATPRVVSLLPALKQSPPSTITKLTTIKTYQPQQRQKIYPSHAWNIRRPDSPLLNVRMPDRHQEGVDMKAHLRFWARTVASTVRQEC